MLAVCTAAMIWLGAACPFDVPSRSPGDNVTYGPSFLVRFVTVAQAEEICHRLGLAEEARACAFWRLSEDTSSLVEVGAGLSMPVGYRCVVITPPYQTMLDHELRHCREGDFHPIGVPVLAHYACYAECSGPNAILIFVDVADVIGTRDSPASRK